MEEISGNRLVWRHIKKERTLIDMIEKNFPVPQGLNEEELKMALDPLGYDSIIDADEIYHQTQRQASMIDRERSIKSTAENDRIKKWENEDYKKWKSNDAEKR